MRYVSEQFKEKQNQLIRPPLKMYFEVATNVSAVVPSQTSSAVSKMEDLDNTVAPAITPKTSLNQLYYAVVGDGKGVDDPNKMCAPVDNSGFATPIHEVPLGVSRVAAANEEILIGSINAATYYNINFYGSITLSFKGGLIPEQIRVEHYESPSFVTVETIDNSNLFEEVNYFGRWGGYYRFWLKNTSKGGRYQINWIMRNSTNAVSFENSLIKSVSINEATDLTSQTLPTYEMTVTCLDVNNEFSPESLYWGNQFSEGAKCYIKTGYEIDGVNEYTPILYGALTKKPSYDQGVITFSVEVERLTPNEVYYFASYPLASGAGVLAWDYKISDRISYASMFSVVDIFRDTTDTNDSVSNAYFPTTKNNARQLIANALGGYITYGFNTIELHNSVDVQYKATDDYVTRYEQVKATLESQPKVGEIGITRNENRVSATYVDIEASERVSLTGGGSSVGISYLLPVFACGRLQVLDYQSSVVSANITRTIPIGEKINNDGVPVQEVRFQSDINTTIKPIVRFYQVDNYQYEENETVDSNSTDNYTNNNELITNSYIANKVKRVAKFISDVSNQYEVDVVQDIRYELGDVIRLETQKNVFKTCVITGLKFNFPGSKGHITCRKIFNIADSAYALLGTEDCYLARYNGSPDLKINGTENGYCVVGKLMFGNQPYLFILGATGITFSKGYSTTTITDNNSHAWTVYSINAQWVKYNIPVVDLGSYDATKEYDFKTYGAKTLLMKLYSEQDMTAPISYTYS